MGMYTELYLAVRFKKDVSEDVLHTISEMVYGSDYISKGYEKILFESERSNIMLKCGSAYFVDITVSKLKYRRYSNEWNLLVHSSFKNYDNDIEKFVNFLKPHIANKGFIGFSFYEEMKQPSLIYV